MFRVTSVFTPPRVWSSFKSFRNTSPSLSTSIRHIHSSNTLFNRHPDDQSEEHGGASRFRGPPSDRGDFKSKLGLVLFLGTALFTFNLGMWQVRRKAWKEEFIAKRKEAVNAPGVDLLELLERRPDLFRSLSSDKSEDDATQVVSVKGRFLYDKQVHVGPRAPPGGQGMVSVQPGFFVITPFQLQDGRVILVNRGWIGKSRKQEPFYETEDVSDLIEVRGVLRKSEEKPQFMGDYDPVRTGHYLYVDLRHISEQIGLQEAIHKHTLQHKQTYPLIYIDAMDIQPTKAQVIRKTADDFLTFHTTPAKHTVYAGTWFSLSACITLGTLYRFRKSLRLLKK